MGVLDDAIREHLDLKRQRGADPTEVEKLEREALGPVRREPVLGGLRFDEFQTPARADEPANDPLALEAHPEYHDSTAPHWQADHFEEHLDDTNGYAEPRQEIAEPKQPKRRGFLRRRSAAPEPEIEPEPRAAEGEHLWPDDYDDTRHPLPEHYAPGAQYEPAEHYEPDLFPQGHFEPAAEHDAYPPAHAGDGAEPLHDDGPATELHRIVDLGPSSPPPGDGISPGLGSPHEHDGPAAAHGGAAEASYEAVPHSPEAETASPPEPEPELEHPFGPIEPAVSASSPEQASSPEVEPERQPRSFAGEPAYRATSQDVDPEMLETRDETGEPPPPLTFENPPRRPRFSTEPPGMGTSRSSDELQRTSEFDVQEHMDEQAKEDVLEETPEFLQDTPEHDRLWFEQRPPRDFDFDG